MSDRVTHNAEWFGQECESLSDLLKVCTIISADDWIVHTLLSTVIDRDGYDEILYTVIAWRPSNEHLKTKPETTGQQSSTSSKTKRQT